MTASKNGKDRPKGDGYTPPDLNTAVLDFEDGPYKGAHIEVSRDASLGTLLHYQSPAKTTKAFEARLRHFGDELLIEWNVRDRQGKPRPTNGDGMVAIPIPFAQSIIAHWLRAIGWVDAPLDEPSSNGSTRARRKRAKAPQAST